MAVSLTPNVPVANVLSSTFYGFWNLVRCTSYLA